MNIAEYKNSLKEIIDSTDNELLLQTWKKQLELDVESFKVTEFSPDEWTLVQEGLVDYQKGDVLSLSEFVSKRQ
jgi:hypothetical protein